MTTVAYSYIRFSSEPQAWGDSRRRQTALADRYARKHRLALDKTLSFRDIGVSAFRGRNLRTGALGAFLDAVEIGVVQRGSYLLVESFDRLSRDQILPAQSLFLQIVQAGIVMVTLIDERVYSAAGINANPYELLISLVAMMRANEESAHKSFRLKKAWAAKRAQAQVRPLTARCPAWLRLDRSTRSFEICPERADTVRWIFRQALAGKGREAIAKMLNKDRIPVMSGRDPTESHWQSGMVARILSSPSVMGNLTPHKVEYADGKRRYRALPPIVGYYPAIVDQDDFAQAQALREQRHQERPPKSLHRRQGNIFAWLARCPLCSGSMRLLVCTQPHWRYLVCTRAFLNAGCVRRGVRYPELEDSFVDAVEEIIEACPWPRSASVVTVRRMREISNRLAELRRDRANLIRTASRVHSTKIRPMRSLQALDAEIDALVEERSSLRPSGSSPAHLHLENRLDDFRRTACSFDTDRLSLNAAMRALFVSIEIDYPRSALRLTWLHGGKSAIKVNPDVMSVKDGWTATSSIPALRRIKPRRPRSRATDS